MCEHHNHKLKIPAVLLQPGVTCVPAPEKVVLIKAEKKWINIARVATYECKVQATNAYIWRARRDRPRDPGPAADAAKPLDRWPTDQDVFFIYTSHQQKYIGPVSHKSD